MNNGYNQKNMSNMNFPVNIPNMRRDTEEDMYPEVYNKFFPITDKIINDMEMQYGDVDLNEDLLNQMVEEAIRRSGMDKMDNINGNITPMPYDIRDGKAVPTIADYGRRPGPGRHDDRDRDRDFRRHFDRDGLSDILRILFLQQIFGKRRHNWRWR